MKKQIFIEPIPDFIYNYFKNISNGVDYGKPIDQWKVLWYENTQFIYKIPSHSCWNGRFTLPKYVSPLYIFADTYFSNGTSYTLYLNCTILSQQKKIDLNEFILKGKEKVLHKKNRK